MRALAGQLDSALADCNESLRLRPSNARTLGSRGFVYLKSGRLDSAIADYDEALRLDPKNAYSLYGRGLAKQMNGDTAGGAADIAAAINVVVADDDINCAVKFDAGHFRAAEQLADVAVVNLVAGHRTE